MTTITGSDTYFTNIDSAFTATKWEACIEQAKDKINGYAGQDLIGDLTGAAGSKSLSVNSMAAGFIRSLTVAIYQKEVKSAGAQSTSFGIGALQTSQSASSSSSGEIEELAERAAKALMEVESDLG